MKAIILVVQISLFFSGCVYCQQDIVKSDGVNTQLHRENIGKIVFTDREIAITEMDISKKLRSYRLTNKSDLFITVFMQNSLTNALHLLASDWSADSLTRYGGYQFALYVDNKEVYRSNIQGAPYPAVKNTETIISKPLIDNKAYRWWSQSFWNRFMYNGGDSALTEGRHILEMEIRPYLQVGPDLKTGPLIAAGELPLEVKRVPDINLASIQLAPLTAYDGLPVSADKYDTQLIKRMKGNIDEGVFKQITSVVVIKNGKLLIEEYFNDANRESLHDTRSVGKSFASTMAGIAIKEGYLKSEKQAMKEFYKLPDFANYSPLKEGVTIQHLLTMSSVFDGNDDQGSSPGNEDNMYPKPDWVKFALDLPVNTAKPNGQWQYFTAGVVVIGDVLHKTVPGGLEKYADEKLFKPLHISKYKWQYTPQKVANTAGGLQMNALDYAKYGQLYKNKGRWNGRQIIPEAWVNKTFTRHKEVPGRTGEFYGYLFWNKNYNVKGKSYETFYCAGNGGNKIFVFTDKPLVIVVTATAYGAMYAHGQVDKMMTEYILPAVIR